MGGAVLGGLVGAVAYTRHLHNNDDGFFEPFSTTLVVGGSAAVGALGGLVVGRIAQSPPHSP